MTPLKVVVVDDEPLARRRIVKLLRGRDGVEVAAECSDGPGAVRSIVNPDLIFLDVQMSGMDGFEVLEALEAMGSDRLPAVIFTTAYDEYALRAFEVHALDYLLKPFDDERFENALERVAQHLARRSDEELGRRLRSLLEDLGESRQTRSSPDTAIARERFVVRSGGRVLFILAEEIDWAEAEGSYVSLHTRGKSHLLRESMRSLESRLPAESFLRVHRSAIVNLTRVREIRRGRRGEMIVLLDSGASIRVSEPHRAELQRRLAGS
jgi:two-component system LytT family response regulator